MKFSAALALGLAPLSMASKVHNVYPPSRRNLDFLNERDGHLKGGLEQVEHVAEVPAVHEVVNEMKGKGFTAHAKTEVIIIWANPGGENVETTTYNEKVTVTETVTAPGAHATPPAVHPPEAAASHTVVVGGPDGLIYQPEQLHEVAVGDMIIFEFLAENHTVTQSTFDAPCEAMEGGMDSGHQPNPDNSVVPAPQVAMQVTTSDPLWFYCKTGNHCGSGMVFSVNPTKEKSHAAFKELAISQNGDGAEAPITGGDPAAEEPAAEEPPVAEDPAAGGSGPTPGQGTIGEDGSCLCMVSCSSSSFPAAEAQGLGAWGGVPGSMPVKVAGLR